MSGASSGMRINLMKENNEGKTALHFLAARPSDDIPSYKVLSLLSRTLSLPLAHPPSFLSFL